MIYLTPSLATLGSPDAFIMLKNCYLCLRTSVTFLPGLYIADAERGQAERSETGGEVNWRANH